MSYTLTDNEAKLPRAVVHLQHLPDIGGRCLGYIRAALNLLNLRLPPPQQPHSTALACWRVLSADPAAYGWQRVHQPEAHPVLLVFYGNCGFETADNGDRIEAGHVALLMGDTLYSSKDYADSQYWHQRLLGAFIPA